MLHIARLSEMMILLALFRERPAMLQDYSRPEHASNC